MSKKKYIAQFGFGTVGQGFYEILKSNSELNIEVKKIGIKNSNKERELEEWLFTDEPSDDEPGLKDSVIALAERKHSKISIIYSGGLPLE